MDTNRKGGCNTGDVYAEGIYTKLTDPKIQIHPIIKWNWLTTMQIK